MTAGIGSIGCQRQQINTSQYYKNQKNNSYCKDGRQHVHQLERFRVFLIKVYTGYSGIVNLLEENGLEYIEIDVPPYSNPINYKGQYHYRSGSTKQELKGTALNRFIMQKTGRHWDEFPIECVFRSIATQGFQS